jgi:signal transduction histidine kinase
MTSASRVWVLVPSELAGDALVDALGPLGPDLRPASPDDRRALESDVAALDLVGLDVHVASWSSAPPPKSPRTLLVESLRMVAHDLNNPLAAIRMLCEMLEADARDDEMRRDLRDILEAVDTASGLVEGLGAMLRLTSGHRVLVPGRVDLRDILRAIARRPALSGALELRLPERPVPLDVDADMMAQALADLLLYAKRAHTEGSRIEVSVSGDTVVCAWRGGHVPAELLPLLLEPWRAAELRAHRVGATPLGLAYAAWAIEQHGGTLTFAEEPDGRSAARVRLPSRADDP